MLNKLYNKFPFLLLMGSLIAAYIFWFLTIEISDFHKNLDLFQIGFLVFMITALIFFIKSLSNAAKNWRASKIISVMKIIGIIITFVFFLDLMILKLDNAKFKRAISRTGVSHIDTLGLIMNMYTKDRSRFPDANLWSTNLIHYQMSGGNMKFESVFNIAQLPDFECILLSIEKSRNFQSKSSLCPINSIYEGLYAVKRKNS